jgi:hypothetical protein
MWDLDQDEQVEDFRVTPGFIAFAAAMVLPTLIALFIYLGAWAVADEVRAAEASSGSRFEDSEVLNGDDEVAGWKKSLVGICPLH